MVAEDDMTIVYEDNDVIVVNKPEHGSSAVGHPNGTLVNALLHHADHLSAINDVIATGVHQFDKILQGY